MYYDLNRKEKFTTLAALLIGCLCLAGENGYLGAIASPDGGSFSNYTTATTFPIPQGSKVTMYCTAATQLLTDNLTTATSGTKKGLPIAATTIFPTSVGRVMASFTDGGIATPTAVIAIIPVSGTSTCDVWLRMGTE
jgi:hypothetical protein